MKSTGITKHIDKLGRFKIPKELRTSLNIESQDSLCLVLHTKKKIVCYKIEDTCIFCHGAKNIRVFKNKNVCINCAYEICNLQKC